MDWDRHIELVETRELANTAKQIGKELKLNYIGEWNTAGVKLSRGLQIGHGELWELLTQYKYMCKLSNVVLPDGKCLVGYGSTKMERCLELGCDWGHCFSVFESYFEEVHGIEVHQGAVARGTESGYNIIHGVMEHMPYEDGCFDVVMSNHVLEHGISASIVLNEIHRVTKIGGWSIHTLPCRVDLLLNAHSADSIHQTELTWRQWNDEFHNAGFSIDKLYWSWNHNQEEINIIARKF